MSPFTLKFPSHIEFQLNTILGPSINGLVTDGNTKLCCRGFILALFRSNTANKIDSEHTQDYKRFRALTPLFGNGAGAHGIRKISGVLTKIGKLDIVLMYDVYNARLIPIIKLTLVYYEKRERKKQVFLYSMK